MQAYNIVDARGHLSARQYTLYRFHTPWGATFTQPPMPVSTLKFSGLSFMKNFKAWSSCNTDPQVVEDVIARSADTLASLRVGDSHIDCLRVLANQVLELSHLRRLQ